MRNLQSSILGIAGLALASACSSPTEDVIPFEAPSPTDSSEGFTQGDSTDPGEENPSTALPFESMDQQQLLEYLDPNRQAPLAPAQQERIRNHLIRQGIAASRIGFLGQRVFVDDVMRDAVSVLNQIESEGVSEKGRVYDDASQVRGSDYTRVRSGNLQVRMPSQWLYHFVIAGGADDAIAGTNETLRSYVQDAVNELQREIDCFQDLLFVLDLEEYWAIDGATRAALRPLFINFGDNLCPGNSLGCANPPNLREVFLPGIGRTTRMSPGVLTSIEKTTFGGLTELSRREVVRHELGHVFGLAHQDDVSTATLFVNGTNASPSRFQTVMFSNISGFRSSFGTDDVNSLNTLYPPGNCPDGNTWATIP